MSEKAIQIKAGTKLNLHVHFLYRLNAYSVFFYYQKCWDFVTWAEWCECEGKSVVL